MTVDQFLAWCDTQPGEGRYELVECEPIAMAPESTGHNRRKRAIANAIGRAIDRAGACYDIKAKQGAARGRGATSMR